MTTLLISKENNTTNSIAKTEYLQCKKKTQLKKRTAVKQKAAGNSIENVQIH